MATYYTDLGYDDEKASGYFDKPWNWESVKKNVPWSLIFASSDDPYINIEEPRLIKEKLNADYYEFEDKGHFGYDRDTAEFQELLEKLKEKLNLS
ncbi:MAG: esterase [Candidatus Saccharibacteria bacterium]|nr:esterase [Candidatus Saccharibacteria bacterium]